MANDGQVRIDVTGLKELRSALKRLDETMPKELRAVNKRAAAYLVPFAKARAQQNRTNLAGHPTRLGSAGVNTIRALAGQSKAQIAMGGARVPYAKGQEWGSGTHRQFPPATKAGYILFPTIREKRDEVVKLYGDMMDDLTKTAFPD